MPAPGLSRRDAAGIEQVWVPAGRFRMGTDSAELAALATISPPWVRRALAGEAPAHTVALTRGFWIDRYEVTNGAFQAFVAAGGYRDRRWWTAEGWAWLERRAVDSLPRACGGAADHPRVCVTWFEAAAYAAWRGGRLPTEAEWEFAARGPAAAVYPWGDAFEPARAHIIGATGTAAVGSYPRGRSWVGADDMAGNAMEWVSDWLAPHGADSLTDPAGPASGRIKIEKGGWWGSNAVVARAAYRHYEDPPDYQDHHIGFRIVTTGEPPRP